MPPPGRSAPDPICDHAISRATALGTGLKNSRNITTKLRHEASSSATATTTSAGLTSATSRPTGRRPGTASSTVPTQIASTDAVTTRRRRPWRSSCAGATDRAGAGRGGVPGERTGERGTTDDTEGCEGAAAADNVHDLTGRTRRRASGDHSGPCGAALGAQVSDRGGADGLCAHVVSRLSSRSLLASAWAARARAAPSLGRMNTATSSPAANRPAAHSKAVV